MSENANYPVTASQKSIQVLETIYQQEGGTLTELASALGMNKSTVHNHLKTLEDSELVVQDESEYQLGLRLLEFGGYAKQQHDLYRIALPEIERLAEQTNEIASLMVEEHGLGVYLATEAGDHAVDLELYPGSRRALHVTAGGKAILAELPTERIDEIVETHGLVTKTSQSITSRDELEEHLAEVRQRGIAFDDEEQLEGLRSVAAPIRSPDGAVLGAISVSGPVSRLTDERFEDDFPAIINSALNVIELNISQS